MELVALDLFLGLALLFAATVVRGPGHHTAVHDGLIVGGGRCLAGLFGPGLGRMPLQRLGILEYAGVFPVVCLALAVLFRRSAAHPE